MLKNGQFENKELQYDWTSLGEDQFNFEILEVLKENEHPFFDHQKELSKMKQLVYEGLLKRNIATY